MSIEVIQLVWGVIPAGVALLTCIVSIAVAAKSRTGLQVLGALIVISSTAGSLWILKEMFIDQAWPTYIPHIAIGITAVVAFAQWFSATRRDKTALSVAWRHVSRR